jgi:serine/threonine-protein kinase
MDESRSQQAEQLFIEALELEPTAREAFLDRACGNDKALRRDVKTLLDASARSADYFDKLPERMGIARLMSGGADERPDAAPIAGEAGQQFGQYTLTEPVGSGGMGTVWRAARSDGRFEGNVAVKLLSRLAGGAAPERFALEGQYLAKLTHPNIARLLDAGVGPNEQPYLVLEYINGLAIDQYCDEQALNIETRIRLFLSVLDAVAHAHARLIVHRDIKPSNVQVSVDGTVKLLDFGVAKLLSDEPVAGSKALTREMGAALTPEYAAPEQLDGDAVTTATDIYSLGLLLWLLVTGSNPRETAEPRSLAELRALAHQEPTRLFAAVTSTPSLVELGRLAKSRGTSSSELLKTLRSDLDNIVRKALAVDPDERYATVADFAQDLRSYLQHEPVTAQAPTIRYRAQKFVRRHRGGVLAATLTVLALVSAAAITAWQGMEAQRQRDAAVYQQQRLQAANEFLTLLLDEVGPQGQPLTLIDLLDHGVAVLDRQYGSEQRFVGSTYYDIALRYAGIGQANRTLELLGRAEGVARAENDADLLAATLCAIARNEYRAQPETARQRVDEAMQWLESIREPASETQISCARAGAIVHELDNEPQAALDALLAAFDGYGLQPFPSAHTQGVLLNDIANMHYKMGRLDLALGANDRILELLRRTGRDNSLGFVIVSLNRATLLHTLGEIVAAYESRQALLPRLKELEADGLIPATFSVGIATSLMRLGRYDEALQTLYPYRADVEASGDLSHLAQVDVQIGGALALMGELAEARTYLDGAEEYLRRTPGVSRRTLNAAILYRAHSYLAEGDVPAAKQLVDDELAQAGATAGTLGNVPPILLRVAAEVYLAAQEPRQAEEFASALHEVAAAAARDAAMSADVGQALMFRARAKHLRSDSAGAARDVTQALPSLRNGLGTDHPDTRAAEALLALLES